MVYGQLGQSLAVDLDTGGVDQTHELAVAQVLQAGCGVDTLDPQRARGT